VFEQMSGTQELAQWVMSWVMSWEKEDYYRPSPMTKGEVIQSWPEHCGQGLDRNDCLQDLAGS
jgi:hypothetical protein